MTATLKPRHTKEKNEAVQTEAVQTPDERPIWEQIAELGAQIPDADWEKVPNDSSLNFKHYLHGAPRKDV